MIEPSNKYLNLNYEPAEKNYNGHRIGPSQLSNVNKFASLNLQTNKAAKDCDKYLKDQSPLEERQENSGEEHQQHSGCHNRPNALKRSATLPAKTNRLQVRNRVTFRVPCINKQSKPSTVLSTKLNSSDQCSHKNYTNVQQNNSSQQSLIKRVEDKPNQPLLGKMTSEDLLQPGHVVKERWKVNKFI